MRRLIPLLIVAVALLGCKKENTEKRAESPFIVQEDVTGKPAVDFEYADMDGKRFRLSENRGKVVLMYFWRMKCRECRDQIKPLEKLYERYSGKGLIVVAVGADTMHSAPIYDVQKLLDDSGAKFIRIRDDEGFVSEAFGVMKTPTGYIIDKNGIVASMKTGDIDWTGKEIASLMDTLLQGK